MADAYAARSTYEITAIDSDQLAEIEKWTLPQLQDRIHEWAIRKQWRGPDAETQRTTGDDIALIVSEAAEALEAFREKGNPTKIWWTYDIEVGGVKFKEMSMDQCLVLYGLELDNCTEADKNEAVEQLAELKLTPKPQGVGVELADVLVRILDYCAEHNINFLNMMQMVLHHNDTREIRHGGKHL